MKRFIIIQLLAVVFAAQIQAQGDGEIKYRRSSLYSMMINHEGREFGDEIKDVFLKIPVPDKYNNHDEGGNLAASKIRNLECPSYEICLIDYGCGKFNRKIHIMEQYP